MIRIGIIGAGPMAMSHGKYFATCGRAKVVAVADPLPAPAEAMAKETGAKTYSDYRQFLDQVDAVVVASPNFLHREQAIAVAQAGKHLYCEKPVGLTGDDARAIAAAVKAAKVTSQVGFSVRFDPTIQEMLRRLRAGELGALLSTASRRLAWMEPAKAGWRADHSKSGGLLYEINIHEIEWMMYAGEVTSVYARIRSVSNQGPLANDHIWVTLNYANGAVGTHEGSWLSPTCMFYRNLQGTEAGFSTNEWGGELYFSRGSANRETVTGLTGFDVRGNFLDAISGTAKATADVEWGVKVMTVCDAIRESARTGLPVTVHAAKATA
jgi:predicted dehydrogenase